MRRCSFQQLVFDYYNRMLCKQITKSADSVNLVPFILPEGKIYNEIKSDVELAVALSKKDWDSHETSWDFEANPLVAIRNQFIVGEDTQSSFNLSSLVNEFSCCNEVAMRLRFLYAFTIIGSRFPLDSELSQTHRRDEQNLFARRLATISSSIFPCWL